MTYPKLIDVNDNSYTDDPCEPCDGYGLGFDGMSNWRHCNGTGYKRRSTYRPGKSGEHKEVDQ